MVIVGIVGEIGAGKTLVSQMFCEYPFTYRIGLDEIVHEIVLHPDIQCQLYKRWGFHHAIIRDAYLAGIKISRSQIAKIVFAEGNIEELIFLEEITKVPMTATVYDKLFYYDNSYTKMVVIDGALLFESGLDAICDKTIWVTAPLETRVERCAIRKENGEVCPHTGMVVSGKQLTREELIRRSKLQEKDFTCDEKKSYCKVLINDENLQVTRSQIRKIWVDLV